MNIRARLCLIAIAVAACGVAGSASAAAWKAGVDERAGLPFFSVGGTTALSASYAFWGKDWAWSAADTHFRVIGPFEYSTEGKVPGLGLDLASRTRKASDRQLVWDFDFDAARSAAGAVGGGISFRFDLADFGATLGEPELLAGNRGWAWGRAGGNRIELRFDRSLADVHFERGQKSEIRAFFYSNGVPQGRQHFVATLSLSGEIALDSTILEKFGPDDPSAWPSGIIAWKASPVDLSFLNAAEVPAGKHGFLRAHGERLVFEDGTAARFWGANLTANALFGTPHEEVRRQAHRLSELGFNLVRLHHHDSEWVDPNIFGERSSRNPPTLSATMIEKLDWWIKCLRDEGIYTWIDLQVGRQLRPADGIDNFAEISKGSPTATLSGYNYVNDSIRRAMQRFNELYLGHQNPFTGLRYKDDAAIAVVLVTNENDVTSHFGNLLLPDKGVPGHNAIYMREAAQFAAGHGLAKDRVWRAWEDGPPKLFLNDLERRFNVDMLVHLHALGVRAPIVTTSTWGLNPQSSLPALTVGDLIDVHSYGGVGELGRNPQFGANLVDWIAAAQVAGKPLSVSEWGLDAQGTLAPDRQDIPLYVAASAAMQGWDAVVFYAYAQEALSGGGSAPSVYQAYNDPALLASLPAAALLYRRGHVSEAATTYVFAPRADLLFQRPVSAANSVALRTAAAKGRLLVAMPQVAELPWLEKSAIPAGATLISDPQASLIPAGAAQVVSDSGELTRNWDEGSFTINTPQTQAAMGWIGGRTLMLADVELALATRNAVIAVQSLDGSPLAQSRRIMISAGARSVPSPGNSLPYYSEPVSGRILIHARPGLRLSAWNAQAGKMRPLAATYRDGRYDVALDRSRGSSWLLLEAPR